MFGWRRQSGRTFARKLPGLLVLLCLCAATVRLPLGNSNVSSKDRSQPFPCQDRPCGCQSAEQCWKQCCCFTNAEKLAWARKNSVAPPEHVVASARREVEALPHTTTDLKSGGEHSADNSRPNSGRSCCSARSAAQQCCAIDTTPDSAAEVQPANTQQETTTSADETGSRFVIGVELLKCRGQGLFWNGLPWAVLPTVEVPRLTPQPNRWEPPGSASLVSFTREPPEPPPRLS